jgi:hypothetical protein
VLDLTRQLLVKEALSMDEFGFGFSLLAAAGSAPIHVRPEALTTRTEFETFMRRSAAGERWS